MYRKKGNVCFVFEFEKENSWVPRGNGPVEMQDPVGDGGMGRAGPFIFYIARAGQGMLPAWREEKRTSVES